MAVYLKVRARYSKGTLKLKKPLGLPEGAEVSLTVTPLEAPAKPRKTAKREYLYPNRTLPPGTLEKISGILSLGGDALADSEALYDGD